MAVVRSVLVLAHAGLAAVWLGAMAYSLFVVQPKVARFFASDDEAEEAFLATLAAGNRWPVLGTVAGIAASGVALLALPGGEAVAVHAIKGVLLLAALAVFVHVSWRHWPRRVFALPEERPALHRQLRRSAMAIALLVGAAFALGVLAAH